MAVKVFDGIYIGDFSDAIDAMESPKEGQAMCFVAKTLHKQIAKLDGNAVEGYHGNMPKDSEEYIVAFRPERKMIAINLIDAPSMDYISKLGMDTAVEFVCEQRRMGRDVLICCDQGMSRSVSVAFLYAVYNGFISLENGYEPAKFEMSQRYPTMSFGKGIDAFVKNKLFERGFLF